MNGWLVVNSYIISSKFNEIYEFLKKSALKFGLQIEIKTTIDVIKLLNENIKPDYCIFWDKDIYVAEMLEKSNVRLFNSKRAVELCDNKILTYIALDGAVEMPKTIIAPITFEGIGYNNDEFIDYGIKELGLPLVVKEAYGSFGKQVYLIKSKEEFKVLVNNIGHKHFLIQEYIKSSSGQDIRVNVVGGKVISAMKRFNNNDFRSNISNGGKYEKFEINKQIEEIAVKACETLNLDFAGVDVLMDNGKALICEVNSNPHFKSSFDCNGIDLSYYIMEHIWKSLK